MKLIRKLKTAASMPAGNKLLFVEALFTSAYVRFTLSYLPFKIIKGWLGKTNFVNDEELTPEQLIQVRRVHHALKLCNQYAFWKTECYTLALTGKILLKRRNVDSTLHIGFKKQNGKHEGHAWLTTPKGVVAGNMDLTQFQVNAFFC